MLKPRRAVQPSSRDRLRESAKKLFAQRGFVRTTTAEIAREARTSQSQLIKHFGSKEGILQAILEHTWREINPALRIATQRRRSPLEKLQMAMEMVLGFLERDSHLRTVYLLESRRSRGSDDVVAVSEGFLQFVGFLDSILKEMVERGELAPGLHPQAVRAGLCGAMEEMLRDHMLAQESDFPASYTEADCHQVFSHLVSGCLRRQGA